MTSLWSDTAKADPFPQLGGDVKTDVLIIGGGMAGVLCAHFMRAAGVPYILVESGRIGGGVTANTTAKITAQHGLLYRHLLKDAGRERAKMYLNANLRALDEYRALCAGIPCDFEEKDAYIYTLDGRNAIAEELAALHKLGYPAAFADSIPLPFRIAGAVRFPKQAQFHPLKFLAGITRGMNIFEHTAVRELVPSSFPPQGGTAGTAFTDHGKITAEHIIVATHFPFLNKHGEYFLKLYQHRSYAVALQGAPDVGGMYLGDGPDGLSFRNHDGLLTVGGGDHKTGADGGDWRVLRSFAGRAWPGARERYAWATQDCMSLDGVPYIGRYSGSTDGLYVATGFNKWGMTSAMAAGRILTDMILGRANEYADVFSPQRSMLRPRLLLNGLNAVGNLLTPTVRRCPHMGCALKWNRAERSWDCPCHGSRFDRHGALLDNPATGGIRVASD